MIVGILSEVFLISVFVSDIFLHTVCEYMVSFVNAVFFHCMKTQVKMQLTLKILLAKNFVNVFLVSLI